MRRKVVKQGVGTLMVSIPSKWAKQQKIVKGSEVNLDIVGNNLLVSGTDEIIKFETSVNLSNEIESSIRTIITNTYRRGFDKITVFYENEKQFRILDQILKTRLVEFEVVKKTASYCIIENVTEPASDQFDNIFNKIFYSISELMLQTKNRITKGDDFNFEEIEERIRRYDNFCRRLIVKRKISTDKSELIWTFLSLIIHGQREIYFFNKNYKSQVSSKIIDLFDSALEIFNLIKNAYFEKNVNFLNKVHAQEKIIIYQKGYNLLKKSGTEAILVYHLLVCVREFYQCNSPLMGILI